MKLQFQKEEHGGKALNAVLFVLALAGIVFGMYLLNVHTPLQMDDYDYSISWATGEKLESIPDVFRSQAVHYFLWGGRSVVHFIAQLFLMLGKGRFNAANACMYGLLLLEIAGLSGLFRKKYGAFWLLAAHLSLFLTLPFFGTCFLWLDGSCNYLWGTCIVLLPLLISKHSPEWHLPLYDPRAWLLILVCFLAGWTNENTACGIFAARLLWILYRTRRNSKPQIWEWVSLAAEAAGIVIMLLAPGNFGRVSASSSSVIRVLAKRAAVALFYVAAYSAVPVSLYLLISVKRDQVVPERKETEIVLLAAGIFSGLAIAASPQFSERTLTGLCVALLSAVLSAIPDEAIKTGNRRHAAGYVLLSCLVLFSFWKAFSQVKQQEEAWQHQLSRIEEAVENGEETVEVSDVVSVSRYTQDIAFSADASAWPNSTLSRFYPIKIIKAETK